jgi:hypothetical protein
MLKDARDMPPSAKVGSNDSSNRGTGAPSSSLSRSDSLISLQDFDEVDATDARPSRIDSHASGSSVKGDDPQTGARVTPTEIVGQVWYYVHSQGPRQAAISSVRPFSGVLRDGFAQPRYSRGEVRLKHVIKEASPEESITPPCSTRSIIDESFCAQKVLEFMGASHVPLPTFLEDAPVARPGDS